MSGLRFKGLFKTNQNFDSFLEPKLGWKARQDGSDWVVPFHDRALRTGIRALRLGHEIGLSNPSLREVADEMANWVPSAFHQAQARTLGTQRRATVLGGHGLTTEIDRLTTKLALVRPDELREFLATELLPFMIQEMEATHVAPITSFPNRVQAAISAAKIALFLNEFGITETERSVEERLLLHVLPNTLNIVDWSEIFTVFSPWALTLPISYLGCTWHFYRSGGWQFPHAASDSFIGQFQSGSHAASDKTNLFVFDDLEVPPLDRVWSYLGLVVDGLNRIVNYFTTPLSFLTTSNEWDSLVQVQSLCALNLLFADLAALNFSTNSYNRITYSFGAIDKMANLRFNLRPQAASETEAALGLISLHQAREVRRAVGSAFSVCPDLATLITQQTRAFYNTHRHVRAEIGARGIREEDRLKWLRALRNLGHGSFLRGPQFRDLFLHSRGRTPPDLVTIPILLALALMSDPERFLGFTPRVGR